MFVLFISTESLTFLDLISIKEASKSFNNFDQRVRLLFLIGCSILSFQGMDKMKKRKKAKKERVLER